MVRKMLLIAGAGLVLGGAGCRHRCCKLNEPAYRPRPFLPEAPRSPILLPPAGVPTQPAPGPSGFAPPPGAIQPGPSNFPPPALDVPGIPPRKSGPDVLFPDPLPGTSSARPASPPAANFLGAPARPQSAEPPKASPANNLPPGAIRVKDGLYAGPRPTLDGFDALKAGGFRSVVYLHAAGADTSAVKDLAATRGLTFHGIEATPETLAAALTEFNRVAGDRLNRPAYVFADDDRRAGAVWYLHLRTVDALNDDAARLRSKPLGLSDRDDEGRAFALAIQRVLEAR